VPISDIDHQQQTQCIRGCAVMLSLYKLAIDDEVDVLKVNQSRNAKAHM